MLLVITVGPTPRSGPEGTAARVAAEALAPLARLHKVVILPGARLLMPERHMAMSDLLERELGRVLSPARVTSLVARVVVADVEAGTAEPQEIIEVSTIRGLLGRGSTVIVAGCIPVAVDAQGQHRPVGSVVEADGVAALLAAELRADALLLLDDVNGVCVDASAEGAPVIRQAGTKQLRDLQRVSPAMTRKIDAACKFVDALGRPALIAGVRSGGLTGDEGTTVVQGDVPPSHRKG